MSYDPTTASCFYCETGIDLALMEHEIRDSQPVHTECAKELDAEFPTDAQPHVHICKYGKDCAVFPNGCACECGVKMLDEYLPTDAVLDNAGAQ